MISDSQLCNLRASRTYQRLRCTLTKTRPKAAAIGQRRKPCPNDQTGYIRIESIKVIRINAKESIMSMLWMG